MTEQVSAPDAQAPQESPAQVDQPASDPIATLLAEITDESGRQKYTDPVTAIKALKASQEYIPQLKQQLQDLQQRAELTNDFNTVQELLSMTSQTEQTEATPVEQEAVTPATENTAPDLETQFNEFLSRKRSEEQAEQNRSTVKQELAKRYGEKASEVYAEKATALGVNTEFFDSMAAKSPSAVLEYFKTNAGASAPTSTVSISSQSTEAPVIPKVMHGARHADLMAAWDACAPNE